MTTRYAPLGLAATLGVAVALPLIVFAAAPTVTITEGPAAGATTTAESVTFAFSTTEASTTHCSITGADDANSFFACASPQNYELPAGEYRFVVEVSNNEGTTSASRTFALQAPEDDGDNGDSEDEEETLEADDDGDGTNRRNSGGSVRYQTPIVPGGQLVAIRPGSSPVFPTVATAPAVTPVVTAPQVAGAQTVSTAPRTTAVAPRTTPVAVTTPAATTSATTTAGTSTAFNVATTVDAGAALGGLDGGVPNWLWAVLVALVVIGVAGYAYSEVRRT